MIRVEIDVEPALRHLKDVSRNQIPQALHLAVDKTAKDFQSAMQLRMLDVFTLRSASTALAFQRAVKMTDFSRKNWPTATIELDSSKLKRGRGFAEMIARHEEGGRRYHSQFYIPAPGMRSATKGVPKALYPVNLGLKGRRKIEGGWTDAQRQGKRRTFVIPGVGIFRRDGPDEIDALWFFETQITLKPRLGFYATFDRVVSEKWEANFYEALAQAIRTAR